MSLRTHHEFGGDGARPRTTPGVRGRRPHLREEVPVASPSGTPTMVVVHTSDYTQRYPPVPPVPRPGPSDTMRQLTEEDGVVMMPSCVAQMRTPRRSATRRLVTSGSSSLTRCRSCWR